jgi:hypothetical protein
MTRVIVPLIAVTIEELIRTVRTVRTEELIILNTTVIVIKR